ncbi:DUF3263 domain-containing protein [Micromonospora sp. NBC_01405]|uniref:DUF3263 domain-containing protein n=1 Tax=Micromonospora sp. NBC_01405 TaxID=2903589 RepID=UPI00324CF9C8
MPPADASPAATARSEPSGTDVREGMTVPPPRSAPKSATSTPASPPPGVPATLRHDAPDPAAIAPAESTDGADDAGTAGPVAAPAAGLTERELRVLAFEQQWWRHAGAKEQAIRDTFGLSATRYYQLLNGLLDNPAALAAEPVLVGRLRRLRSSRARNRRR